MKIIRRRLCTALLVLALPTGVLAAGIGSAGVALASGGQHYWVATTGVDSGCTPNNATHPFKTIQHALDCAAADGTTSGSPDYIYIANGTYDENLTVHANVTMLGASQAGTVINGGGVARTVTIDYGYTVRMNNLTITNGYATNGFGGGIENGGTTYLTNVSVTHSSADNASLGGHGGGIYNYGTMSLANVTVSHNNSTFYGGGIYNDQLGTMTISNSTVSWNTANGTLGNEGGGIYNGGTMTLYNTQVTNNQSESGGGIANGGTITLNGSSNGMTVSHNQATAAGGGIFNIDGTATLRAAIVSWNTASNGGGMANQSGNLTASASTFSWNQASISGGGLDDYAESTATLTNTNFTNNSVPSSFFGGGGIYTESGSALKVTGGRISGNTALGSGRGGGIYTDASGPTTLQSVVITQNSAGYDGGGVWDDDDDTCSSNITILSSSITNNHPDDCS